jgi:hypothetical protein
MVELRALIGLRNFYSEAEIIEFVKESKDFDKNKESLNQALALKIFQTSKQQTWLVSTEDRLYNILDDIEYPEPHHNWSIPRTEIKNGLVTAYKPYKAKYGLVTIGSYHDWFFNRDLFIDSDISTEIKNLVNKTMHLSLT